jgi:signal transduction histidine kinase/ActR/RegA family two-component response regulator
MNKGLQKGVGQEICVKKGLLKMKKKPDKVRINEMLEAILKVAQGDFSVQLQISERNDLLDSLAMGFNMMIDDVRESVEIALQNERISHMNTELKLAKEKAERSDRLKSAFLANMSHEIRTPMNGILGFADLLKKPELTGEQQKKYIHIIEQSGERMLSIINDLIEISKIESGHMGTSLSAANINDQIDFIHSFFNPEVSKKGMQFTCDHPLDATQANILTDHDKVHAILTNLVKNAIKFTNSGYIHFGYVKQDEFLHYYVKDTGIGIAEENRQEIFDRFVQADETISRTYDGAGLGLAISKAYVEMLGGRIWVESKLNGGSTFNFTIPYKPEFPQNLKVDTLPDLKQDEGDKRLKILITEDNVSADLLLSLLLDDFASEILHASNGLEAVEICRKNPDIDLIMMDVKMPEMNGYEAVQQIREFNKNVIVIAQTANALSGEKEKAMNAGFDDYITKPLKFEVLTSAIHRFFKDYKTANFQ